MAFAFVFDLNYEIQSCQPLLVLHKLNTMRFRSGTKHVNNSHDRTLSIYGHFSAFERAFADKARFSLRFFGLFSVNDFSYCLRFKLVYVLGACCCMIYSGECKSNEMPFALWLSIDAVESDDR